MSSRNSATLKSIRENKLMRKQKDVAAELGISQQYLSNIESGRVNAAVDLIPKMATIWGVSAAKMRSFARACK